jgi:hypothetical protein
MKDILARPDQYAAALIEWFGQERALAHAKWAHGMVIKEKTRNFWAWVIVEIEKAWPDTI